MEVEIIPDDEYIFSQENTEHEVEFVDAEYLPATVNDLPNMDQAVHVWIKLKISSGDPRKDTIVTYKNEIDQWFSWCKHHRLHPGLITKNDIEAFRAAMVSDGIAISTIRKKMTIISRFYGSAVEDGYIKVNPAKGVKLPNDRRVKDVKKHLVRKEMQKLLDAIPNNGAIESLRDRAIIALEMIEGWRRVEIHRANVEDIEEDSHEGYRILVHGKIKDGFSYPENAVIDVLTEYLTTRGNVKKDSQIIHNRTVEMTPMFCAIAKGGTNSTRRISRTGLNFIVDKYLSLAGLKRDGISNHALRHTCGYNDYQDGKDLRRTQEKLRHSDPKTTSIYAATDKKRDRSRVTIALKSEGQPALPDFE